MNNNNYYYHNKKSLFTCFKGFGGVYDSLKSPRRRKRSTNTDPVLAYLIDADEDGAVLFPTKDQCQNRPRKKAKDAWRSLRMAINDTSLMKKILHKRKTKKNSMSRSNSITEQEIINKHKTTRQTSSDNSSNIVGTTNSSATFTPSSSLSSSTSSRTYHVPNSSSIETNNIPKAPPINGTNGNNVGKWRKRNIALWMLWIISLLVLIVWGKFFAILCTSIWFYLVPYRQRRKAKQSALSYKENEVDYVSYK